MYRKLTLPALLLAAGLVSLAPVMALADEPNDPAVETLISALHPVTGNVALPSALAHVNLDNGYSFLPAKEAQRVLTELWGNPPQHDVLGMILPGTDPHVVLDDDTWAVVITYSGDGYISDEDAATIDYAKLLKDMQEGEEDDNAERKKEGYAQMQLTGWAEQPAYDAASHKLTWARDYKVTTPQGETGRSLNYDIRVLGRHGYLSLNAIAPYRALAKVREDMPEVVAMTDFDQDHRYADYNASSDKAAGYGIAALVAGGVAAKMGLFAKLGALLLAFKKIIIVAVAAAGAAIKRLFSGKKKA